MATNSIVSISRDSIPNGRRTWNPEVQSRAHKHSPITPIINIISHIYTYFFKINSNIVLQFTPKLIYRPLFCRFTWQNLESNRTFSHSRYRLRPLQFSYFITTTLLGEW